jgi:hypothetical protein
LEIKIKDPQKGKRRVAGTKVAPDPFQELEDLAAQARGTSAGETARLENLLANRQEDYEIAATADPGDAEKQRLADAALIALMKVRKTRVSADELVQE